MSRFAALFLSFAFAADVRADESSPIVADFSLTDPDGRTVTRADLRGKVWIASFIFTRCSTGCPQLISGSLMELQRDFADKDDIRLVSFTVDPDHDRPEVLKAFAESHGSDPSRWLWLTGNREEIYRLIRESFYLAVEENQGEARTPGNEYVHSTRLVLVDREGRIRGYYEGRPTDSRGEAIGELRQLKAAVNTVYREKQIDFPAINAGLNATSLVLIVTGYIAIRRRHIRFHIACMITALVVSTAFLTSYLYYHIVVRQGQHTTFTGEGPVRIVYYSILGSHIILAALVVPLALFTAYQGLRWNLQRHVRIARWTLPIWIYVSATGVIVYWMLYQAFPAQ